MADVEIKKGQYEELKAAYRLFGQGDLMKFWLFEKHRCINKWVHYFSIYERWFSPYRGKEIVFVEVGVENGGSAQMWKNYFGKGVKIVGVDINPNCNLIEDEQITVEIGSQGDKNFWRAFKEKYPRVDILLDDGGHIPREQITTFREMFPHIKDGGIYICEDCHTSYWDTIGTNIRTGEEVLVQKGGVSVEGTFIEFTKQLIDELNAFHTKGSLPLTYNTNNMGGIHFYDSVVVVEKNRRPFEPFDLRIGETPISHYDDAL